MTNLYLNSEKWNVIPKASEFKNELNSINQNIEEEAKKQANAQIFVGKNKSHLKRIISNKGDILNDSAGVFGALSGNMELAQQMDDSASDLFKLKNEDFIMRVKLIVEKVSTHLEPLMTDYGVTKEQLTDFKNDIDQFLEINGMPRAYRVASDVATQDLKELFYSANDVLTNKLDKVMKIFKNRDVNFYKGYLAARMVINN